MKAVLLVLFIAMILCLQTALVPWIPFIGNYLDLFLVSLMLIVFLVEEKWSILYCFFGGIIIDLFYPNWFFHTPIFLLLYFGIIYLKKNMREESLYDYLPWILIILPIFYSTKVVWFYIFTKEMISIWSWLWNLIWFTSLNLLLTLIVYPVIKLFTDLIHEPSLYSSQSRVIR